LLFLSSQLPPREFYNLRMPRTARASVGGICYHVINRGNRRARVFHTQSDYREFVSLMQRSCLRVPMRILSFCLMPNHFHFVMWPYDDGDLSRWMHWLLTTHVVRYHKLQGTSGRVWQGRYKAFPIEQDHHLLTVLRYVERNPVRANLVKNAVDWKWSSLGHQVNAISQTFRNESPVTKPPDWIEFVNRPQTSEEVEALRRCSVKSTPFGSAHWTSKTADQLGLNSSLRGPGRPKRGHWPKRGHS